VCARGRIRRSPRLGQLPHGTMVRSYFAQSRQKSGLRLVELGNVRQLSR
jgi:hypothetical protein